MEGSYQVTSVDGVAVDDIPAARKAEKEAPKAQNDADKARSAISKMTFSSAELKDATWYSPPFDTRIITGVVTEVSRFEKNKERRDRRRGLLRGGRGVGVRKTGLGNVGS